MRDRRFRSRAKITQKMTRHGLVEENQATGEETRISNRLLDVSFSKPAEPDKPAIEREGRYYQRGRVSGDSAPLNTHVQHKTQVPTARLQENRNNLVPEPSRSIQESREDGQPMERPNGNIFQEIHDDISSTDSKPTGSRSTPQYDNRDTKQGVQSRTTKKHLTASFSQESAHQTISENPVNQDKELTVSKHPIPIHDSEKLFNVRVKGQEPEKTIVDTPHQSFSSQSEKRRFPQTVRIAREERRPVNQTNQQSKQFQRRFTEHSAKYNGLYAKQTSPNTIPISEGTKNLQPLPISEDARNLQPLPPNCDKLKFPTPELEDANKVVSPSPTVSQSQAQSLEKNTSDTLPRRRFSQQTSSRNPANKKRLYFESEHKPKKESKPEQQAVLRQAGKLRFEQENIPLRKEELPIMTSNIQQIPPLQEVKEKPQGRLSFEKEAILPDSRAAEPDKPQSTTSPQIDFQMEKAKRRLDKTQSKLEKAQSKLPTERKIKLQKEYDSASGKIKHHLRFEKEVKSPNKTNLLGKAMKAIPEVAIFKAHSKIREVEKENVGVEAGHKVEQGIETLARQTTRMLYRHRKNAPFRRVSKLERATARANVNYLYQSVLHEHPELKKKRLRKAIQKLKIKRQYAKAVRAAKGGTKTAANVLRLVGKAGQAVVHFIASFHGIIGMLVIIIFLFFMMASCMSSCGAMLTGAFTSVFIPSVKAEDPEITASDLQWSELEKETKLEIENAETEHPGYNEYKYILKEGDSETETTKEVLIEKIQHDPFELIAYLDAMYPDFKHADIAAKLEEIYDKVFHLEFVEEIEMRQAEDDNGELVFDENGEPVEVPYRILKIVLEVQEFSEVVREELEQKKVDDLNDAYIDSKGGHQKYGNPLGYYWLDSITSPYGHRENPTGAGWQIHKGVDIAAPMGTPLYAMHDGTVLTAGWHNLFGNTVIVQDDDNRQIRFAHCSALFVTVGQKVKRGENIAMVGSTGNSTGPHVHVEVTENGEHLNPLFLLEFTETEESDAE